MSLIRSFSRRLSGRTKEEDRKYRESKKSQKDPSMKRRMLPTPPDPTSQPQIPELDDGSKSAPPALSSNQKNDASQLFTPSTTTAMQTDNMTRTLYEIPMPSHVDAMTDLIKSHPSGDLFPYVGVVGTEGETPDARRARLLAIKPEYNKRDLPQIQITGCPLISKEGSFDMTALLKVVSSQPRPQLVSSGPVPKGVHNQSYDITKPYVHVKQITALYTPNVSSTSNYCGLWMKLNDTRFVANSRSGQSAVIVSNQEGVMEMSCDYCVSTKDLDKFEVQYVLEREIVLPGVQWGTVSFYINLTESDLPYQTSKMDAMAVYRMPITTLMERKVDADNVDVTFTPEDVKLLRSLYQEGDIVDVDQPQTARLKVSKYTQSSIRRAPKGKELEVQGQGWEFMKGSRKPKVDAMVASVDPDEEEDEPIRDFDLDKIEAARKATLRRYKAEQEQMRQDTVPGPSHSVMVEETPEEDMKSWHSNDSLAMAKSVLNKTRPKVNFDLGPSDI